GGRGVAPRARQHPGAATRRLDRHRDEPLVLGWREGRGLPGRGAGDQPAHAGRDLALDQRAESLLIDRAGRRKRRDEGGPAAAQPGYVLRHGAFLSVSRARARTSSITSSKAYIPRRPTIQRAASSAPAANPARERAV